MSEKPFVPVAPAGISAPPMESKPSEPAPAPVATGAPLPTVAETRAHHAYSPSTLQSLESCPLYQSRQNVKEHERTTAGTRAHNAADSETDDERLSDEDAAAVAECLDYVDALKQQLAKAANAAFLAGPAGAPIPKDFQEINEPYLPIDDLIFPDCKSTTAGYADKILISYCGTIAHVADYKFGMWPVTHAKENLQGIAYALGVFKRWPKIQEITIHFLQPLLNAKTSATLFRSDIPSHYFRICAVVARARVAREQLAKELAAKQEPSYEQATPNVPTCSFCDHLGKCKKALAIAIQVGHKFSPLDIPADLTPTMIHNDKDTSMAMKLAMVVATWAKAFRTVITNRVINGDAEVPEGFTIVSQEKRELVDLAAYRKAAIKIIGAKAFEETLQTTFGAVEKLIAEKAPRGIKTKVVEAFKHETEESGCVTRSLPITFLKAIPKKEAE